MAYNPEEDIKVSDLPEKTTDVVSDDKLLVIDSEDANILKQINASKVGGGGSGTGDMLKSVYDKNNDGVVDDAEALGGKPASDYALSDDTQDKLESGVNIKTINGNSILGPGNIEIQGGSGTVDTEMSDTSTNAVQNKVIKGYVDTSAGTKQDTLVSGTNIKTINNQSLLGTGNIDVSGGSGTVDTAMSTTSTNAVQNKVITEYIAPRSTGVFATIYNNSRFYYQNPHYYSNPKKGVKMLVYDYVATLTKINSQESQTVSGRGVINFADWGTTDVYDGQEVTDLSNLNQFCVYYDIDGKPHYFDDCAIYYDFTLSNTYGAYGGKKLGISQSFDVTGRIPSLDTIEQHGTGSADFGLNANYVVQVYY